MTTPQQTQTPPPPPPEDTGGLVAAVAAVLVVAISADAAMAALLPVLRRFGIQPGAMAGSLQVVFSFPPERTGVSGPATIATSRQNLIRRAQFVVASARRLTTAIIDGRSRGLSIPAVLAREIPAEHRYFGQHLQAIWNRATAAAQVDSAALSYGDMLGWNTIHDSKTSAECRAADGKNFYATAMPLIGWPGAVHPHCRCYAGPAHPGARMLPSAHLVLVRAVRLLGYCFWCGKWLHLRNALCPLCRVRRL
jgi:hypothetical protein